MPQVFLSYSRSNNRYISLINRILLFHRIATWVDSDSIRAGSNYKVELDRALGSADCLVIVITDGVDQSRWIPREVAAFRAVKPEGRIIPLLFDDVPLNQLFDGLGDYQAISFMNDLDAGFSALISELGKPYLPIVDQREGSERRSGDRRDSDRRRAAIDQRLRIGMWKEFANLTGLGQFEVFAESGNRASTISRVAQMFAGPNSELSRYTFKDKDLERDVVLTEDHLCELIHGVCWELDAFGRTQNVFVVERLAETLLSRFRVEARDRRNDERRTSPDRRSPGAV